MLLHCVSRWNVYIYIVKFHPTIGHEGPEGSTGVALTLALDGDGWSTPSPSLFSPRKDPVPTGPVLTGAENLAPTGIRSPDRPAYSVSHYR